MMGRLEGDQGQLFYSFCLDDVVPSDHRVREIAGVLDLSWVHGELASYYSNLGRPSIDPVLTDLRATSVSGVSVEADAHIGRAKKPICAELAKSTQQPSLAVLTANSSDRIGHFLACYCHSTADPRLLPLSIGKLGVEPVTREVPARHSRNDP